MKIIKKTVRAHPRRLSITAPVSSRKKLLYDKDFFKWTKAQAGLLKKGNFNELDIFNLIEEIESLGRNDKRSLYSHAIILLMHLLKQKYQSGKQIDSNSWKNSITNASREIRLLIKDSPSLKNELLKIYSEAYEDARHDASEESGLPLETFPETCPWTIEERFPELGTKLKIKKK